MEKLEDRCKILNDEVEENMQMFKDIIEVMQYTQTNFDLMKAYQNYYDLHKSQHGTYAFLPIDNGLYTDAMQKRKDYIWCNINQDIEEILETKKNIRKLYK